MKRILIITFALLALVSSQAHAQALVAAAGRLNNTTLSGAITATQTTLVLASASASSTATVGAPAAGQCLYIDWELMNILSISSTTVTVRRGTMNRSPHANAAVILTGPCNGPNGGFMQRRPPGPGTNDDCTQYVLPWVDVPNGDTWWCELAGPNRGAWSTTNTVAFNGAPGGSRRTAQ